MVAEERNSPTAYISPQEYLERERNAFEKSEYYRGEIRLMAGATRNNNCIKENIIGESFTTLRERGCQYFSSDMRVSLPETTLFAYPDIVIVCGEPQLAGGEFDNLLNPAVIIEVLSEGTEDYDRGRKFQRYRQIPSFREYILIASRTIDVEAWRKDEDGRWALAESHTEVNQQLQIDTIDLSISLEKVYARTTGILV